MSASAAIENRPLSLMVQDIVQERVEGMPEDHAGWRSHAACRNADPSIFFPEKGEGTIHLKAKALCRSCPVIEVCLDYAITNGERYGVWGGMSARERKKIDPNIPHSANGYKNHGCRCRICKAAYTKRRRNKRGQKPRGS